MYKLTQLLTEQELYRRLPCNIDTLNTLTWDMDIDPHSQGTMYLYNNNELIHEDCYLNYNSKADCLINLIYMYLNDLQEG